MICRDGLQSAQHPPEYMQSKVQMSVDESPSVKRLYDLLESSLPRSS